MSGTLHLVRYHFFLSVAVAMTKPTLDSIIGKCMDLASFLRTIMSATMERYNLFQEIRLESGRFELKINVPFEEIERLHNKIQHTETFLKGIVHLLCCRQHMRDERNNFNFRKHITLGVVKNRGDKGFTLIMKAGDKEHTPARLHKGESTLRTSVKKKRREPPINPKKAPASAKQVRKKRKPKKAPAKAKQVRKKERRGSLKEVP